MRSYLVEVCWRGDEGVGFVSILCTVLNCFIGQARECVRIL